VERLLEEGADRVAGRPSLIPWLKPAILADVKRDECLGSAGRKAMRTGIHGGPIMGKRPTSLLLCLAMAVCARPCLGGFALVDGGRPVAVIRVADKLDKTAMAGVADVVEFVEKMSGAKLSVVESTARVSDQMNVVLVGKALAGPVQPLLARVADAEGGFVVAPRGRSLFLAGRSPLATSFACAELLERLGCRWYMPGELGEVYPTRTTIIYGGDDAVDKPDANPRWLRVDRTWSRFGQDNAIVVKAINRQLNELGTGGIMKIVMLYSPGA
jgi:hypothetical protein